MDKSATKLLIAAFSVAVVTGSGARLWADALPCRYTVATDTVVDTKTGLTWQRGDGGLMAWSAAGTYCSNLVLGGFSDWRLPSQKELFSLVDPRASNPSIDLTAFPGTPSAEYWSGTVTAGTYMFIVCPNASTRAWTVRFDVGNLTCQLQADSYRVRCVRP